MLASKLMPLGAGVAGMAGLYMASSTAPKPALSARSGNVVAFAAAARCVRCVRARAGTDLQRAVRELLPRSTHRTHRMPAALSRALLL